MLVWPLWLPRWLSGKEPTCQCRRCKRHGFNSWVRKIPWRRAWQHSLVFSPGESHGQRSLVGNRVSGPTKSQTLLSRYAQHTQGRVWGFLGGSVVKNPPANAGDIRDDGSIPGLGRSPRRRHGNPLQYSCLEKLMDRGAWQATIHGVTKS